MNRESALALQATAEMNEGQAFASFICLCWALFAWGGDSPRTDSSLSMQLQGEVFSVREHGLHPKRWHAQHSYKEKKLYLLLKDFFCILSLWIQILCWLKPVLSYSLKWHDAGFQQLRIYPMAFRDSVGNCLSSTLIPPSSDTFSGLQENLIDSG